MSSYGFVEQRLELPGDDRAWSPGRVAFYALALLVGLGLVFYVVWAFLLLL